MGGKRIVVTNNYDFKTVTRLRMLCMKVLPTVYGDALSYEEQVWRVTEKINQLVDTVNALPDYIVEVVKELINAAGLEDIVRQVLSDLYFINVKNPPAPLVAAKGDGATNDTTALQAMINYAGVQRKYLFFPAGNYIVTGLTVIENVSLIGLDRYSTIITLAPDSNKDLITGFVNNVSISNMTLNANMNGQMANCSCLNATVDNALIDFVIFRNGYDSVVVENTNEFEGAYWLFDGIQHNALTLNGDGAAISNVIFKNASQLSANALMIINGNNKITGIYSNVVIPNGVVISAAGATIEGTILNARTTITGGNGNYVKINNETGENIYTPLSIQNYTEKRINATDVILNTINPLTYGEPIKVNRYFDQIKMKSLTGNEYTVPANLKTFNDIFNVKDYGAVGDNVTDDTAAITNAINDMTLGGILFFPPGTYVISNTITLSKSITLEGCNGLSSAIRMNANLPMFNIAYAYCVLSQLDLIGNQTPDCSAVMGTLANHFCVKNCNIHGFGEAIKGTRFSYSWFINNHFYNNTLCHIHLNNTTDVDEGDYLITGNLFHAFTEPECIAIKNESSGGHRVIANKFNAGLSACNHNHTGTTYTVDYLYEGNSIENLTGPIMTFETETNAKLSNVVITGNQISCPNCTNGIVLKGNSDTINISGNTLVGNLNSGVSAISVSENAKDINIANNTFNYWNTGITIGATINRGNISGNYYSQVQQPLWKNAAYTGFFNEDVYHVIGNNTTTQNVANINLQAYCGIILELQFTGTIQGTANMASIRKYLICSDNASVIIKEIDRKSFNQTFTSNRVGITTGNNATVKNIADPSVPVNVLVNIAEGGNTLVNGVDTLTDPLNINVNGINATLFNISLNAAAAIQGQLTLKVTGDVNYISML